MRPSASELADRLRTRRLDRVAHLERRARSAVPADLDATVRAPDRHRVALHRARDADARPVAKRRHGRQHADLRSRGARDRLRDRMLGRGLDRAAEAQHLAAGGAVSGVTPTSSIRPSVTVPVLSSTIVSTRLVCSRISGPLISTPSCAPRPVPTINAVGVARPSAHGQAMISTATAAVNAVLALAPASEPAGERQERDHDHDGDEDRGDAVREPLHRGLARLGRLDQARDLRERRVGADLRRAHDHPAVAVERRPGHVRSDGDLDRQRLACEQRLVDRRLALDDDAVGRHLLARAHDEQIADAELGDGDEQLLPVAHDARLLRAELEQLPDRLGRAALGARLQVAAEHDQRRHDRRDLEVDVGAETSDQHHRRPQPRRQRAQRDQRVHRGGEVASVLQRHPVKAASRVEDDRRRQRRARPTPSPRTAAAAPSRAAPRAASGRTPRRADVAERRAARRARAGLRARAPLSRGSRRSRLPRRRRRARRPRPARHGARSPARWRS